MRWDEIKKEYPERSWAGVRKAVWCFLFHRWFDWHHEKKKSSRFCHACKTWWV